MLAVISRFLSCVAVLAVLAFGIVAAGCSGEPEKEPDGTTAAPSKPPTGAPLERTEK